MTAGLLISFGVLLALVLVLAVVLPVRRARRLRNLPPVWAIEGGGSWSGSGTWWTRCVPSSPDGDDGTTGSVTSAGSESGTHWF